MRRKVSRANFHDLNVVVPGIGGNLPNQLPGSKTIPGLQMFMTEQGLEVSSALGEISLIPLANIKIAVYAKDSA